MKDLTSPMISIPKLNDWQEINRETLLRQMFKQNLVDLLEQISDNKNRETIMQQWDYWRQRIANGDESSAPRDWFESVLDMIEKKD